MAETDTTTQNPPAQAGPQAGSAAQATASGTETTSPASGAQAAGAAGVEVQAAQLEQASEQMVAAPGGQLDILLDATMHVSATLGQAQMQVRQLLQLGPGSVVKLERMVGEPIDLYLRGIKFATGHLVVVGDNLGVRIKEILPNPAQA